MPNGRGRYIYTDGDIYEGNFIDRYFHCLGKYKYKEENKLIDCIGKHSTYQHEQAKA